MGKMRIAVSKAIKSGNIPDVDAGAAALLERYADLMDNPGLPTRYRKHLAVISRALGNASLDDDDPAEALEAVRAALSEQSVSSDLGPKLLAGLTALGLTLAGRADKTTREPERVPTPGRATHDEVKARRDSRANRAKAVDATAP